MFHQKVLKMVFKKKLSYIVTLVSRYKISYIIVPIQMSCPESTELVATQPGKMLSVSGVALDLLTTRGILRCETAI